jgi:hypothetical protein
MIGSRTSAQDLSLAEILDTGMLDRVEAVMQDNEYINTGDERGIFLNNPLRLNGMPLDYSKFNAATMGELTVVKGAFINGATIQVPFNAYLRRNSAKVFIPGKERSNLKQVKVNISEILRYAKPGDQLVIEAVRKEDGAVKRILKLNGGC